MSSLCRAACQQHMNEDLLRAEQQSAQYQQRTKRIVEGLWQDPVERRSGKGCNRIWRLGRLWSVSGERLEPIQDWSTSAKWHFKALKKNDVVDSIEESTQVEETQEWPFEHPLHCMQMQPSLALFQSNGFDGRQTAAEASDWQFQDVHDLINNNALNDLWDEGQVGNGLITIRVSITFLQYWCYDDCFFAIVAGSFVHVMHYICSRWTVKARRLPHLEQLLVTHMFLLENQAWISQLIPQWRASASWNTSHKLVIERQLSPLNWLIQAFQAIGMESEPMT